MDERNRVCMEISKELEKTIQEFKEVCIAPINSAYFDEKKPGLFDKFFSSKKHELENENPDRISFNADEEKWGTTNAKEEAFLMDLKLKRKRWIALAEKITAKDIMEKEMFDFELRDNLLRDAVYEVSFREFNSKCLLLIELVKEQVEACRRIQHFVSLLEELFRSLLKLEKRKQWIKKQVKEKITSPCEELWRTVSMFELVKEGYNQILEKSESSSEANLELVFKASRKLVEQLRDNSLKDISEYNQVRQDCEGELGSRRNAPVDHALLKQTLKAGLARFQAEIKTEQRVILLNFFSLYQSDLEKIEENFNKCLEGCDRGLLKRVRQDRLFSEDLELVALVEEYEETEYLLKKLVTAMKKVSINNVSLFCNLRFGSSNFLIEDQGAHNESENFLQALKENCDSLSSFLESTVSFTKGRGECSQHILALLRFVHGTHYRKQTFRAI